LFDYVVGEIPNEVCIRSHFFKLISG